MPHDWVPSRLGHGESMCRRCYITNREAAALGVMNHCDVPEPAERDMTKPLDPAIELQRLEERQCECGAAGSGEGHTEWCPAAKFDRIPHDTSAARALKYIRGDRSR